MTTLGNWITTAATRGSQPAVQFVQNDAWQTFTWAEFSDKVVAAYVHLKQFYLKDHDHVGIVSNTCWQWSALDLAVLGSGCVCVPMYANLSDEDLLFTINHSDISILLYENDKIGKQLEAIASGFVRDVKLICISEVPFDSAVTDEQRNEFYAKCSAIKPKDVATIIYTSGTTGKPKGVVLLHEAIVSEVLDVFAVFNVSPDWKALSFLPFAHVLGRLEHWGSCFNGHCLAYSESIEKLRSNLKTVKPDFLIAVPRIFEKVYAGILAQVETQKLKQAVFNEAMATALEVDKYRQSKSTIPWLLLLKYEALNKIAFGPIREAFGGNLKFAISGGAPIDAHMTQFFHNCGVPILEGYGLSETCGAVTINPLGACFIGTVGKPLGDVEIKIADDGEILVKSAKCLREYYKNPEETAKVTVDGYFATGDIGEFTTGGYLRITDRKKDLIKTAGGKYVAPQKLEGLLKQEPLISQVLIHGDQKKYIVALITVDESQLKQWARANNVQFENASELFQNIAVKMRIQKHVQTCNSRLASYEAIKKFEILNEMWTVENGALTQSLKVKRKFLEKKYAELIDEIYD